MMNGKSLGFWILGAVCALPYPLNAADRALFVGVGIYENREVSALPGTQTDVTVMHRLLTEGFSVSPADIKELRNEAATRSGILSAIDEWLINGTKAGDRVFLYYSGHGSYVEDINGDEGDGYDEALVPYDVACTKEGCSNMVLDDEIGDRLKKLGDRYVVSIFDSCHSGTVTRSFAGSGIGKSKLFDPSVVMRAAAGQMDAASTDDTAYKPGQPLTRSMFTPQATTDASTRSHKSESGFVDASPEHVSLFAVQSFQLALEVPLSNGKKGGLFTHTLVDAVLDRKADFNSDGSVSFGEIKRYLDNKMKEFCSEHPRDCLNGLDPLIEVPAAVVGLDVYKYGTETSDNAHASDAALSSAQVASILSHGNDANLRVTFEPGSRLNNGDLMRVNIASDRSGLLFLLDRDASGALTVLYPYEQGSEKMLDGKPLGWIRAGGTVTIPDSVADWEYEVMPPYGDGFVIAVLAEHYQNAPVVPRAFEPVSRPAAVLGDLRLSLDALVDDLDDVLSSESPRWSVTIANYKVVQ